MNNCSPVISKCFNSITTRNAKLLPYKNMMQALFMKKASCHITYSAANMSSNIQRVKINQGSIQTPGQVIDFELSVVDTHPGGRSTDRPTVVAIHGAPGSSADFDPLPQLLLEKKIRCVVPAFPGYELSELDSWKMYHLDYTADGQMDMMKQILHQLGVEKVSMLMCHSAGSWLGYKMAAELDCVKSLALLNPCGARPHRTLRPNFMIHLFAWLMHRKSLHFAMMPLLERIYAQIGFSGVKGGEHLVATMQTVASPDFKRIEQYAQQIKEKQLPLVFAYTLNDKLIETSVYEEMLFSHLDVPKEAVTVIDSERKSNKLSSDTLCDDGAGGEKARFAQAFQFARGGHIAHKSHSPVIFDSIVQLLAHVEKKHA